MNTQQLRRDSACRPSMAPARPLRRAAAGALALAAALLVAACAMPTVGAGEARETVLSRWGQPTARYAMAGGGERLEYASGPYGRTTWMIDIDAGGRVAAASQVLNEAHFADFQGRAPGMSRAELLRELGRPGEVKGAGLRGGELWSWRYPTNDCLWFQVEIDTAADKVRSGGYGIDPRCDPPSNDRS